jgi:peptidoglycan LD-endopeptidase CwlK
MRLRILAGLSVTASRRTSYSTQISCAVFSLFVVLYFLLACFLVWVLLFPEGREFVAGWLQALVRRWRQATQSGAKASQQTMQKVTNVSNSISDRNRLIANWVVKHKWGVAVGLLLVTLPPLGIILFSAGHLEGFSDERLAYTNPQIEALLKGEQLVPPAPLPPEIFVTAEVEQVRPMLQTASRNWQLLDQELTQRLLLVFKIMREKHGYEMAILEGYRSPERQDMLAKMGGHVTNARAFQSYHQFGLAADCAFLLNGKLVISEKDPWAMKGYQLYGETAESVGLTWGGRWKMMDLGHIEWRKPGVMK